MAERESRTGGSIDVGGRYDPIEVLGILAAALFWGWLGLRWLNDWFGGLFVREGQAFLPPSTFEFLPALAFAVEFAPELAAGVWLTVLLTIVGIALGFPIAIVLAGARVYGRTTRWVALGYIELVRGTPLLAQLFVLYYGLGLSSFIRELPGVGTVSVIPEQAVWVAMIGFTINSAAYQAEYLRGAIESVDPGQLRAARAIGLSQIDGIRYVVLPQALRYAIPGWTNELIYLIKYSSLAAFITVPELFNRASSIASENFRYLALFSLAGLFYLALVLTATNLTSRLEDRVAIPGLARRDERLRERSQ
ncbi:amino acid ABC transporter permease [Halobacteriales archaeon QS_3_64_16]|nr:MAG: amino acid ABC transporter permease [Halobacteriales archaeon QS_3_64_16]